MPDYKLGKIYQIWSPNTDEVYIGSTVQPLHKRFHDHKTTLTSKKYTTAREVLKCGEAKIELIEDYPCEKKSELNRREGQVMRGYDNRVNVKIAGRTPAEWRADNKEHIAAYQKEYYQKPGVREHIAAQKKEYRQQPEVKARRAAQARERYWRKEYQQRPEVKESRNALARERYWRKKEQQQTASA
jgi:hypothetical protein